MAGQSYVYTGAVKSVGGGKGGVFRQALGGGDRWEALTDGLPGDAEVHAITVPPDDPNIMVLGTTKGPYRTTDNGGHWQRLALPEPGADVWSITVHPTDRRTVYAGYGPTGV